MAELDSLIDELIQQRQASEVSFIYEEHAQTLTLNPVAPKGQGLFAQHALPMSSPICSLKYPTMMAIDSEFLQTTCYHCLAVTATQLPLPSIGLAAVELKTCHGCLVARFCDRGCQRRAWSAFHKFECKIFRKVQSRLPSSTLRAVLRAVLLKDRNMFPSAEWTRITALVSHVDILAAHGRTNLTAMAEEIKFLAESSMSVGIVQKLIFIVRSNATELPTSIHGSIGVMLDPLLAKVNHSCEPNVAVHRPHHTMASGWVESPRLSDNEERFFVQIIPLRDIQEGEELVHSYVSPTLSVNARRAKLMENYFFQCDCRRCLSDLQDEETLAKDKPNLLTEFGHWTKEVIRHLSRVDHRPSAIRKAADLMYASHRFLEHPVLYTTGDFPHMATSVALEGIKGQAFDEALVNLLRLQFLVNPQRFVGSHNPTCIYTSFVVLDILDVLLSISTGSGIAKVNVENGLRGLSDRGLSKGSLIYWRHRVCKDLQRMLSNGAPQKDLRLLVGMREEQAQQLYVQEQAVNAEEGLKTNAEHEMRKVLGLREPGWERNTASSSVR